MNVICNNSLLKIMSLCVTLSHFHSCGKKKINHHTSIYPLFRLTEHRELPTIQVIQTVHQAEPIRDPELVRMKMKKMRTRLYCTAQNMLSCCLSQSHYVWLSSWQPYHRYHSTQREKDICKWPEWYTTCSIFLFHWATDNWNLGPQTSLEAFLKSRGDSKIKWKQCFFSLDGP